MADPHRRSGVWTASDEALLAGLGTADPAATVAFVRRYQRRVFGLALLMLHDEGLAEDVAQEVFLRAWRHAATFDGRRGSVTTWLLTITRNLAIDALRSRQARPSDLVGPEQLDVADLGQGPADAATTTAEVRRVKLALGRLPVEQRRAVLLAALQGRTAAEIGVLENIPLGTAKTRIRTALRRLRDDLVEEPTQ